MRRTLTLALSLLLATTALAGCTGGDDDDTPPTTTTGEPPATTTPATTPAVTTPAVTPTPPTPNASLDSSTYTLAAVGMPGQAKPGEKWNFTLYANGSVTRASDHIGGHFADNDTFAPVAANMKTCEHVAGSLPGTFTVFCTVADEGAWHVYGHARINDSGELRNWWAATPFVVKVRNYTLVASGHPTNAQASNATFTFKVDIKGKENVTSDHIGAHFWNTTEPNPTAANSAGACEHFTSGSIGNYTVTCRITNPGLTPVDYVLRGHIRIAEGGTQLNWWSDEFKVTVLGSLPVSPI